MVGPLRYSSSPETLVPARQDELPDEMIDKLQADQSVLLLPMSEIENLLLGPRKASPPPWRLCADIGELLTESQQQLEGLTPNEDHS